MTPMPRRTSTFPKLCSNIGASFYSDTPRKNILTNSTTEIKKNISRATNEYIIDITWIDVPKKEMSAKITDGF